MQKLWLNSLVFKTTVIKLLFSANEREWIRYEKGEREWDREYAGNLHEKYFLNRKIFY